MNDNKKHKCALCRYCTYEQSHKNFVCHNESSHNYGKLILTMDDMKLYGGEGEIPACDDYSGHEYKDMPLKDALCIITGALSKQYNGFQGAFYDHKLPDKDNTQAYVILAFKTNNDLERWRDAHTRIFTEYMNMAKADGDFKTETDESDNKSYDYWRENIMDERLDYLDSDEKYELYLKWYNENKDK